MNENCPNESQTRLKKGDIEKMNEGLDVQGTETEQTEPAGGTKDMHQEKTFTQEEVDNIVEKRLSRERKKFTGMLSGKDPKELELEERENAVRKKEMQISARSLLSQNGIPDEALDLLNYEDDEKLKASVELLKSIIDGSANTKIDAILRGGRPLKKAPEYDNKSDDIRSAFGFSGR